MNLVDLNITIKNVPKNMLMVILKEMKDEAAEKYGLQITTSTNINLDFKSMPNKFFTSIVKYAIHNLIVEKLKK